MDTDQNGEAARHRDMGGLFGLAATATKDVWYLVPPTFSSLQLAVWPWNDMLDAQSMTLDQVMHSG